MLEQKNIAANVVFTSCLCSCAQYCRHVYQTQQTYACSVYSYANQTHWKAKLQLIVKHPLQSAWDVCHTHS